MGIFNLFKTNDSANSSNNIDAILTRLNLNPYDFNHEEMERVEITIDDELNDVVEVSELIYDRDKIPFDYINLSDKSNGKKSLFVSMSDRDEREVKNLIDLCYSELGEDFYFKETFTSDDLYLYRNQKSEQLRNWNLIKYDILIGFSKNNISETVYVIVTEK